MIKNREVLRMAGYMLDEPWRMTEVTLAENFCGCPVASADKHAYSWSLDGAVMLCAIALRKSCIESLADLVTLFGTKNYASHWDRSLSCPRWTQDEMVEMLKNV